MELLARPWEVELHHVYLEANGATDDLAKLGRTLPMGTSMLYEPS